MRWFALVLLGLCACGVSESDAKAALESDGYTEVQITGKSGEAFNFTAKRDDGAQCTGTITVKKGFGSSSTQKQAACVK